MDNVPPQKDKKAGRAPLHDFEKKRKEQIMQLLNVNVRNNKIYAYQDKSNQNLSVLARNGRHYK